MAEIDVNNPPAALALYYYDGCPFCTVVQSVIDELDIEVSYRNIMRDLEHRRALMDARGRTTVPVLAITPAGGDTVWLPESRDIIAWLQRHFAGQ